MGFRPLRLSLLYGFMLETELIPPRPYQHHKGLLIINCIVMSLIDLLNGQMFPPKATAHRRHSRVSTTAGCWFRSVDATSEPEHY